MCVPNPIHMVFAVGLVITIVTIQPLHVTYAQADNRINWGQICNNPIVDAMVAEPCSTLTSLDGYTLTHTGERVLICLAGGGLLLLADPTGETLIVAQETLGPAAGCGGNLFQSASGSQSASGNSLLGGLLQEIVGK